MAGSEGIASIPAATSGRGVLENQGLTGIDFSLAQSLHTIGSRAFAKNKLTAVTIPVSVQAFGNNPLTNGVTLSQTLLNASHGNAFPAGTSFKDHAGNGIHRGRP